MFSPKKMVSPENMFLLTQEFGTDCLGLVFLLYHKGEQGTAEFGTNTVLKQTNELCF